MNKRFTKKRAKTSQGQQRVDEYYVSKTDNAIKMISRAICQGISVKLFFVKPSKRGSYNVLLTTNTALSFEKAYKIYANRRSIEVFFRESKQYLQPEKCQSQDFDAQIAATTLSMLQYNLLAVSRRFSAYQTNGEMFKRTCCN